MFFLFSYDHIKAKNNPVVRMTSRGVLAFGGGKNNQYMRVFYRLKKVINTLLFKTKYILIFIEGINIFRPSFLF